MIMTRNHEEENYANNCNDKEMNAKIIMMMILIIMRTRMMIMKQNDAHKVFLSIIRSRKNP